MCRTFEQAVGGLGHPRSTSGGAAGSANTLETVIEGKADPQLDLSELSAV